LIIFEVITFYFESCAVSRSWANHKIWTHEKTKFTAEQF